MLHVCHWSHFSWILHLIFTQKRVAERYPNSCYFYPLFTGSRHTDSSHTDCSHTDCSHTDCCHTDCSHAVVTLRTLALSRHIDCSHSSCFFSVSPLQYLLLGATFRQQYTNPGRRAALATKFVTLALDICWTAAVWTLRHVTLQAPPIFRWIPQFCKISSRIHYVVLRPVSDAVHCSNSIVKPDKDTTDTADHVSSEWCLEYALHLSENTLIVWHKSNDGPVWQHNMIYLVYSVH